MQNKELYLRPAVPSDMDMLFELANDETVRKNAFHMAPISYGEHMEWFRKMMEDDSQLQFILMSANQPIGQIRLTVDNGIAEIGYSIIQGKRGMGYGKKLICLVKELVYKEYPYIYKLTARVKTKNAASIRCVEENGFFETYKQYEFEMVEYCEERETQETLNDSFQKLFEENVEISKAKDTATERFKRKFIAERTDYAEDSPEKRDEQDGGGIVPQVQRRRG